jgi:hypothetical protein
MIDNALGTVHRYRSPQQPAASAMMQLPEEEQPLPPVVLRAARACATHFEPSTVPVGELRTAVRVYVMIDDTARTAQTMRRWLALKPDGFSRGRALFELMSAYFDARPLRAADMLATAARLDSLPRDADLWRVEANNLLAQYWTQHYNLQNIVRAGEAAAKAYARLPASQTGVGYPPVLFATVWAGQALLDAYGPTVLDTIRRTAKATFHDATPEQIDEMVRTLIGSRAQVMKYGTVMPALDAAYKYDLDGRPQRPAPGHAMLLYRFDPNCETCQAHYAELRRLAARYGDTLEITLVAQTRGFLPGTGVLSPAEEAPAIRKYTRDILALPFGLLIEDVPPLTAVDGRKFPGKTVFDQTYGDQVAILDREGKLRWVGTVNPIERLDEAVRRATAHPATP